MSVSALDIAKFFISRSEEEGRPLTNMKLQKLCFYAQALYLVRNRQGLVSDAFEAWDHGPVCPEVYHEFKHNGSKPIASSILEGFDLLGVFDNDELDVLEDTWLTFGHKSAGQLRNMTHGEYAWKHTYNDLGPGREIALSDVYLTYSKRFGEVDRYDTLLKEYRDESVSEGTLPEPTEGMVSQMKENHLMFSAIREVALKEHIERVK